MKFGNFHDEGGSYFEGLELEDNSKSDNKVLFVAPGSADPVLYEGKYAPRCVVDCKSVRVTVSLPVFVGVLKQKELSEFIVAVIKGNADLTPRKKAVVLDTPQPDEPESTQDSEVPKDTPVVHEEL
jgi:hypothetical protein